MKSVRIRWVPAALLLLPLLEIVVIVLVGRLVGWAPTAIALAALSILGIVLVRRTGRQAWAELARDRSVGAEPAHDVADRALVFAGGMLLIPPGFVTDVVALVLLLPFTRPLVRNRVRAWAVRRGSMQFSAMYGDRTGGSRHGPTTPHRPDVVHGEVIDEP